MNVLFALLLSMADEIPRDAIVIETAKLAGARPARTLVLWMSPQRQKVVRDPAAPFCKDWVIGDYWSGPTRLSVLDDAGKVIHTLAVHGLDRDQDTFDIPFRAPADSGRPITAVDATREGKILNLRDLTGDGRAFETVLFAYIGCGAPATSVFGFDAKTDRVVQYPAIFNGGAAELWVPELFFFSVTQPGMFDGWRRERSTFSAVHEVVRFDARKRAFVGTRRSEPDR